MSLPWSDARLYFHAPLLTSHLASLKTLSGLFVFWNENEFHWESAVHLFAKLDLLTHICWLLSSMSLQCGFCAPIWIFIGAKMAFLANASEQTSSCRMNGQQSELINRNNTEALFTINGRHWRRYVCQRWCIASRRITCPLGRTRRNKRKTAPPRKHNRNCSPQMYHGALKSGKRRHIPSSLLVFSLRAIGGRLIARPIPSWMMTSRTTNLERNLAPAPAFPSFQSSEMFTACTRWQG